MTTYHGKQQLIDKGLMRSDDMNGGNNGSLVGFMVAEKEIQAKRDKML